jgi:hypothetical protein
MQTPAEVKPMTVEDAKEFSEHLWLDFQKEGEKGVGYYRCSCFRDVKYPPNYAGICPICGEKLEYHTIGF